MDIEDWRSKIDRIDMEILNLINERAHCAIEIGRLKHKKGLPIYSAEREKVIFDRLLKENDGPLEKAHIKNIFSRIIDESRSIEREQSQSDEE